VHGGSATCVEAQWYEDWDYTLYVDHFSVSSLAVVSFNVIAGHYVLQYPDVIEESGKYY
jgi:hypothetical protein